MRIDEFEFQDRNGNEIEPTKDQLVIYIKSLHRQIKDLKDTQNQVVIKELEKLKHDMLENLGQSSPWINRVDLVVKINKQIENLKGE